MKKIIADWASLESHSERKIKHGDEHFSYHTLHVLAHKAKHSFLPMKDLAHNAPDVKDGKAAKGEETSKGDPIWVAKEGSKYSVIEGKSRLKKFRENGIKSVKVIIFSSGDMKKAKLKEH